MSGKLWRRIAVLALATFAAVGCREAPDRKISGVIVPAREGLEVGDYAPEVTFIDAAGKARRLSSIYADATVVAIVEGDCTMPVPELREAGENVTAGVKIVEIYKGCRETDEDCLRTLEGKGGRVVSLCDGEEILSRRYGLSEGNVVFILDGTGRVVERGSLSDIDSLTRQAARVAISVADARARLYGGN